jgi:uncharacterized membrane protein
MILIKKISLFVVFIMTSLVNFAQDKNAGIVDTMRSNGRIYVVVAVVLTILIGLFLYVIRIDRKISKMEKEK